MILLNKFLNFHGNSTRISLRVQICHTSCIGWPTETASLKSRGKIGYINLTQSPQMWDCFDTGSPFFHNLQNFLLLLCEFSFLFALEICLAGWRKGNFVVICNLFFVCLFTFMFMCIFFLNLIAVFWFQDILAKYSMILS